MTSTHIAKYEQLTICPVCNSANLTVLEPASDIRAFITSGEEFSFHMGLSACGNCGFIFVNPRATQAELTRYYGLQARKPRSFDNLDKPYSDLLDFQTAFIKKQWMPKGKQRILDVGSAEGFFLKRLSAECNEAAQLEGVEPGSLYAAAARALMPDAVIHEQVLEETDLPHAAYDLVTLRHVLEHLVDPVHALTIIRRLVKATGLLHIEVPDVTEIPASLSPFIHHEHMNSFTPATLKLAIERAGFEIVVHESAQDNPVGSGFSYPIQRLLARPAPADRATSPHVVPDSADIYRGYAERQALFLQGQIESTRLRIIELSQQGKRVGIFGAGPHTFDFFRTLKLSSEFFVLALDNNPHKLGKHIRGLEIVLPSAESVKTLDAIVVSSAEFEGAMVAQIESFGVPGVEIMRLYGR